MIDGKEIGELARFAAAHGVSELEFGEGENGVAMRLMPAALPSQPLAPAAPATIVVRAPAFGRFQPADATGPVAEGTIIGHVRLDALLVPVRAPVAGTMGALPQDGAIVGFGDTLTTIQPAEESA